MYSKKNFYRKETRKICSGLQVFFIYLSIYLLFFQLVKT